MASIGHIEVEVRPTVTLESAEACVMMLNLFLAENEDYDLVCVDKGNGFKWELTDEPRPRLQVEKPSKGFAEIMAEANEGYRNMSDEEKRSLLNG